MNRRVSLSTSLLMMLARMFLWLTKLFNFALMYFIPYEIGRVRLRYLVLFIIYNIFNQFHNFYLFLCVRDFVRDHVFSIILNFALRALGLSFISLSLGIIIFLFTRFPSPASSLFLKNFFTTLSSKL